MAKTSCSIWKNREGKILKLFSNGKDLDTVKRFYFTGWNPFPCYSMNSTFHIVAEWLKANGWERQPGGFETIVRECKCDGGDGYETIVRETIRTRFVPQ